MWKNSLTLLPVLLAGLFSMAQQPGSISTGIDDNYDNIRVELNATDGHCHIVPGNTIKSVDIQKPSYSDINSTYEEKINGRTKEIKISLNEAQESSIGTAISKKLFSTQEVNDMGWKVYLSPAKPMDLNLAYAVGDTRLDLSGLPIERLKLITGSANVFVNYRNGHGNTIAMDTMLINVDMGSLVTKNLHMAHSQHILADVGFGSVLLDFHDAAIISTSVDASVGAGKLEVILPEGQIPVRININNSPLCRVKIPEGFTRISDNEFVSNSTGMSSEAYVYFNVDVAVGNVIFK